MAGEPFAQACSLRRSPDPVADVACGHPEYRCARVQQLLGGPDGLQGLAGLCADVEGYSLRFLVGLGPAKLQQGGAVVPELYVAAGQGCGLRPAQQPVTEYRQQCHIHPAPPGGPFRRLLPLAASFFFLGE